MHEKNQKCDVMLLGLAPQGLFLLQQFAKAGKKVIAVGMNDHVGIDSRHGNRISISRLDELDSLLSEYCSLQTAIHITSDMFLNYVLENTSQFYNIYKIYPNYQSASIFCDKILTEELARNLGLNCLESWKLSEVNADTFDIYPSIVKWNKRYGGETFKTVFIEDGATLKTIQNKYISLKELIIQRYISGGSAADVSYGGYFEEGKNKVQIIIKQTRQYPYPNGLSSYAEEYNGEFQNQVYGIAEKLMEETAYSGFVEVECRIDEKERKAYLIEVNPRACGWIKILKKKYVNICDEQYALTDLPPERVCWVNLVRDMRAVIDTLRKNPQDIKWKSVLCDYARRPSIDLLEPDDIMPFIMQFKKIFHKDKRDIV